MTEIKPHHGCLFIIEGIDGSGKTTFIDKLRYKMQNRPSIVLHFPRRDTDLGKYADEILTSNSMYDNENANSVINIIDKLNAIDKITSYLEQGVDVYLDRFLLSQFVYSPIHNERYEKFVNYLPCEKELIFLMLREVINNYKFQFIFLKIDPELALKRCELRAQTTEKFETLESLKLMRTRFDNLVRGLNATSELPQGSTFNIKIFDVDNGSDKYVDDVVKDASAEYYKMSY